MVRLVLFDIDGTLVHTGGAGVKAFAKTFATEFRMADHFERLKFAGRTDYSLVREFFGFNHIEPTPANFERFFERYAFWLDHLLRESHTELCPGVWKFIHELQALPQAPLLGLLTGTSGSARRSNCGTSISGTSSRLAGLPTTTKTEARLPPWRVSAAAVSSGRTCAATRSSSLGIRRWTSAARGLSARRHWQSPPAAPPSQSSKHTSLTGRYRICGRSPPGKSLLSPAQCRCFPPPQQPPPPHEPPPQEPPPQHERLPLLGLPLTEEAKTDNCLESLADPQCGHLVPFHLLERTSISLSCSHLLQ
jgi:hypothetical protein